MVIDHIGVVVGSLESAIQQWEAMFGYTQSSQIVLNTRQKVKVVFLSKESSVTVKLIEPSEPSSPVALLARRGGGFHHVCFRCSDVPSAVTQLVGKGARLLVAPEPGEAFNSNLIAFLMTNGNLNIELIDTTRNDTWNSTPLDPQCATKG
jgi:methylmalonyl-CoA/ethylmalonyl-CoA epimerase